jgi:ABC-type dipeptide/oligopeptide/nickel transport system permease component
MEAMILFVALVWLIPFFFVALILTFLAAVPLQSKLLYVVLSTSLGTLLAAGWLFAVRNGFDAIARTLIPLFALGFLASGLWVVSMRTVRQETKGTCT